MRDQCHTIMKLGYPPCVSALSCLLRRMSESCMRMEAETPIVLGIWPVLGWMQWCECCGRNHSCCSLQEQIQVSGDVSLMLPPALNSQKCNCCIKRPNCNTWRMCGTLNLSVSYRNSCIIHSLCKYVSLRLFCTYQQSSVSLGLVLPDSFWNWTLNCVTNGAELGTVLNNS